MKRVIVDVGALAVKFGIPTRKLTKPDGRVVDDPIWDLDYIDRVLELYAEEIGDPETIFALTNIPHPWITMTLKYKLAPHEVRYIYLRAEDGVELDFYTLRTGEPNPDLDVVFEIIEEGDRLFVNLNSDNPAKPRTLGPHTFDLRDIPDIVIPPIPSGRHLYLHGKGMYCVMDIIADNYAKVSKSASIASHAEDYFCFFSAGGGVKVGDTLPVTHKNTL